jgi:hypothetical protein
VSLRAPGLLLLAGVAGAWLGLWRRPPAAPPPEPAPALFPVDATAARRAPRAPRRPPRPPTLDAVEPHPITAERLRIDEQQRLFDRVEAAVDARDFPRARALLDEHPTRFPDPEGWPDLRDGWRTIADCLEHPGPAARARGQRYVDEERASPLRRRVRRACLEGRD